MNREDQELLDAFKDLKIGLDVWNQRTHVALAFIYLYENGFDEGLEKLRSDIKRFNAHNGIEESPTSGYNETTTVAMLRLVHTTMQVYGNTFPVESSTNRTPASSNRRPSRHCRPKLSVSLVPMP